MMLSMLIELAEIDDGARSQEEVQAEDTVAVGAAGVRPGVSARACR